MFKRKILLRQDEYIIRWTLLKTKWFALRLHKILMSDDEDLHDHPWNFYSLILKGGYYEQTMNGEKWYGPGRLLIRPAETGHRLRLPAGRNCWTLVLMTKRFRVWGFYKPTGWKPYYECGNFED